MVEEMVWRHTVAEKCHEPAARADRYGWCLSPGRYLMSETPLRTWLARQFLSLAGLLDASVLPPVGLRPVADHR